VTSKSENFRSGSHEPVSVWIEQLAVAEPEAARRIWEHFCGRLMAFARGRLKAATRGIYDEEDAAISAFRSLCRGIEARRFPEVTDRDNLWALLVVITGRKILNRHRYDRKQRRNSTRTITDSALTDSADSPYADLGVAGLHSKEPTPEFSVEVADTSEYLLQQLPQADLRQVVLYKLEGYTNEEVADAMSITRRTVQRKLERIRRLWLESDAAVILDVTGFDGRNDL